MIHEADANAPRTDPDTRGKWYNVTSPLLPLGRQSSPSFLSLCSHSQRGVSNIVLYNNGNNDRPHMTHIQGFEDKLVSTALNTARSIPTGK